MAEPVKWSGDANSGLLMTEGGRRLQLDDLGLNMQGEPGLIPASLDAETISRKVPLINNAALTSGTLRLTAIWLPEGATVLTVYFFTGTQAAVAPTNAWLGLFDRDRALLSLTSDTLTGAIAANSTYSNFLTGAPTTTYAGLYYLGMMVAAGTAPSLICSVSTSTGPANLAPIMSGASNTGLTTPASFGAGPATAITVSGAFPYAGVSFYP